MIKTIFLDVDDTLFDFKAGQRVAFFETFKIMNYEVNEEIYELYDSINIYFWKKFERGEIAKERLVYARFEMLFEKLGIVGDAVETEANYQRILGEQAVWIEGAEDGLKYLCSKYDVYVTTNGYGETQRNRTHKRGIDKYVKGLYISEVVGYPKPRKEYFDYCLRESHATPETTVTIGDSLTSDIKGGINAGTKTVWFNYRNDSVDKNLHIDYIIHSWKEIYKIL